VKKEELKKIILKKVAAHRRKYRGQDFAARVARAAVAEVMTIIRGT